MGRSLPASPDAYADSATAASAARCAGVYAAAMNMSSVA